MVNKRDALARGLVHHRAHLVFNEMQNARLLMNRIGEVMPAEDNSPWLAILDRLYSEEFPLAKLLDESELIAHAEGPGLVNVNPRLDIVTWLCNGIQSQTRSLTASALSLGLRSRAVQSVQFRLTGLAPGSLFAGFAIADDWPMTTVTDMATAEGDEQQDIAKIARESIVNLTRVPAHVDDQHVSESLGEEISDPATRDASLMAALKLAPTGRNGVHSVQLQSRFEGKSVSEGTLDLNNRIIIQETLRNKPLIAKGKTRGSFIGQLRALDLDKTRVDLRSVAGVGTLRCIVNLDLTKARHVIGNWVQVTGEFESNANGKPRLMMAEHIEVVPEPTLADQLRR